MKDNFVGLKSKQSIIVSKNQLASSMKSGLLDVFATPSMIALMEQTASTLIQKYLPEDITSVGSEINIKHLAPTPLGAKVYALAEIIESDGRNFAFSVEAYDEVGLIGKGTHKRSTVKSDSFLKKAEQRKK